MDRPHVVGDVFANAAVASRRCLRENPIDERDRQRQPVNLWLHRERECARILPENLGPTFGPGPKFVDVKDVVQTEHWLGVLDWAEDRRRRSANLFRDRRLVAQLGMLSLQRPQFSRERVVVRIGNQRRVVGEVRVIVPSEFLT